MAKIALPRPRAHARITERDFVSVTLQKQTTTELQQEPALQTAGILLGAMQYPVLETNACMDEQAAVQRLFGDRATERVRLLARILRIHAKCDRPPSVHE